MIREIEEIKRYIYTVIVGAPAITANSTLLVTRKDAGVLPLGNLTANTIVAGTGFTISSDEATDTSTVYWSVVHKSV
jgi:hypothetical protein